jgi:hypothetical protein
MSTKKQKTGTVVRFCERKEEGDKGERPQTKIADNKIIEIQTRQLAVPNISEREFRLKTMGMLTSNTSITDNRSGKSLASDVSSEFPKIKDLAQRNNVQPSLKMALGSTNFFFLLADLWNNLTNILEYFSKISLMVRHLCFKLSNTVVSSDKVVKKVCNGSKNA